MKAPNKPTYSIQEATQFIYDNISNELKVKYRQEQIYLILILQDDFYDLKGINVYKDNEVPESDLPPVVEEDELVDYICEQTLFHNTHISKSELKEILQAEFQYCIHIGLVNDGK